MVNYHHGKTPDEPPPTPITYPGRAFDAAWRSAAAQRIEQYRKADLTVTVQDSNGQPVSGADVQVAMTRHAFGLGTAVNLRALTDQLPAETRERYEREAATLFNTVVFESELEWPALEGDWGAPYGTDLVGSGLDWAATLGLGVRGHALVDPGWPYLPRSLKAG